MKGASAALLALLAMIVQPCCSATAAPATQAEQPQKKSKKAKDVPFEDRLAAGEVIFTTTPMQPLTVEQIKDLHVIRNVKMERAANDILFQLTQVHQGTPPQQLPFFVIDSDSINCSTLPSGGAILCTRAVFDQLVSVGEAGRDQLAFLLAHELAHMTIASHRERFAKSQKLKDDVTKIGVLAAMVGLMAFSDWKKTGGQLTMAATQTATSVFWTAALAGLDMSEIANGVSTPAWARQDEDEADAYAMILMERAHYKIDGGPQFLASIDRILRANGRRSTRLGAIAKSAGKSALMQGIMNNGNTTSIVIGAITGAFAGNAAEAALAHYHRSPDKRAAVCADFVHKKHEALRTAAGADHEADDLFAAAEAPPPAPTPTPAAKPVPAKSKKAELAAKVRDKRVAKATTPAVFKDSWTQFLDDPGSMGELILAHRIRELINEKHLEAAVDLCPPRPTTGQLLLVCGTAYAGAGDAEGAELMLAASLRDPGATADTYRNAAQVQASLGQRDKALEYTALGLMKFPEGDLYPDDMMIRAAFGDMPGAERTAGTCKEKAADRFKSACQRGWAQIQSANKSAVAMRGIDGAVT